jgi:hypothetical protein
VQRLADLAEQDGGVATGRQREAYAQAERLRACAKRESTDSGAHAQVARALGVDPLRDCYIHGHLWATPMAVNGPEVYFGHPQDRTFVRLDPGQPVQPWNQLFEAVTGRRVAVPAADPR